MVDQSAFAETQAVLQAPPVDPEEQKAAKKRNLILAGVGGFVVLMIMLGIAASSRRPVVVVEPTPTPSPTPLPMTNAMKQELDKAEAIINRNNPDDIIVTPPRVDMQVEF